MESKALELRLICGLLASAARLVPVPLLDDILREKALHLMVSRTIKLHGRAYRSASVAPLYGTAEGCGQRLALFLLLWPIKLLLYPIKKVLSWIMAAKNVAADLSEAVLLGRTLDRVLANERLPMGADAGALRTEAARVRLAFDNALRGTDLRLLRAVLRRALEGVKGLPRAAVRALRRLRNKADDADPTAGLSAADREKVDAGASRIAAALEAPDVRAFLEAFDARFDENLRLLEQRAS